MDSAINFGGINTRGGKLIPLLIGVRWAFLRRRRAWCTACVVAGGSIVPSFAALLPDVGGDRIDHHLAERLPLVQQIVLRH